jgi:hypothetical protein
MLSFGISGVNTTIVLDSQCWMGLTRNELHIVSKDGLECRSRSRTTLAKVMVHIRGICVKVAITDIVGRFSDVTGGYRGVGGA